MSTASATTLAALPSLPVQILLIEDNPGDVRLTEEALRETGASLNLHVASDGAEAIAFLNREGRNINAPRPDLVLLDLYLPKVDGRMVLSHIKSDENLKTIPTVILTASASESDVVKSYRLHANCYLRKPHQWSEFKDLAKFIFDLWSRVATLPPLRETHQRDSPAMKPPTISWLDPPEAALLRSVLSLADETAEKQLASVSRRRGHCILCNHPQSDHQDGRCVTMIREQTRRFLQCGCRNSPPQPQVKPNGCGTTNQSGGTKPL